MIHSPAVPPIQPHLEVELPQPILQALRAPAPLSERAGYLLDLPQPERHIAVRLLPVPLFAALVESGGEFAALLAEQSLENMTALLRLCSARQQAFWLQQLGGVEDPRATLLLLLTPSRVIAEALLSHPAFERHVRAVLAHPIERERVTEEMLRDPAGAVVQLFGPEGMLRQFPIDDEGIARVAGLLLELDIDRYVDILMIAFGLLDQSEEQVRGTAALTEEPVYLRDLPSLERLAREGAAAAPPSAGEDAPYYLASISAQPLALLVQSLPAPQSARVAQELQQQYARQAIAAGGSFSAESIQSAVNYVDAYVQLGLQLLGKDHPAGPGALLANCSLRRLMEAGGVAVEGLRQIALRLQPFKSVLTPLQRAVVDSACRARLRLNREQQPVLMLQPARGLPREMAPLPLRGLLAGIAAWTDLARRIGIDRLADLDPRSAQLHAASLIVRGRDPRDAADELFRDTEPEEIEQLKQELERWAEQRGEDVEALKSWIETAAPALRRCA